MSRDELIIGQLRSEIKCAIPKLSGEDIEWLVSLLKSHIDAEINRVGETKVAQ
jgi:hypothetical protein